MKNSKVDKAIKWINDFIMVIIIFCFVAFTLMSLWIVLEDLGIGCG